MVYLFLKEVAESTDASEVIIVVQSLCKDMNNSVDIYRSNAIRTLAKIIDVRVGCGCLIGFVVVLLSICGGVAVGTQGSMLGQIERYIKQAIVDNNDTVSSAALLCGLQLASVCRATVSFQALSSPFESLLSILVFALPGCSGRCEALGERDPDSVDHQVRHGAVPRTGTHEAHQADGQARHLQGAALLCHALAIAARVLCSHLRLLVSQQLVSQLMKTSLRSPLATVLLIRYTADLLRGDVDASAAKAGYDFLEACTRHKSEMVIYEAARAMCDLPGVVAKYDAVHVLLHCPLQVVHMTVVCCPWQGPWPRGDRPAHVLVVAKVDTAICVRENLIQDRHDVSSRRIQV